MWISSGLENQQENLICKALQAGKALKVLEITKVTT